MKLQGFRVLADEEMERIHRASLHLLQRVGVRVLSKPALELLAAAGAQVDLASQLVRFPSTLVEESLATLPSSFLVYDQLGKEALEIGGRGFYSVAGMDGNYVFDPASRTRRNATKQDVADFARLADALPNIHFVSPQVIPHDVPGYAALPHAFEVLVQNSTKPIYVSPGSGAATATLLDMAQEVAGAVPLAERPIIVVYAAPTSPLVWQPDAIEAVIEAARRGVPLSVSGAPLMGMMAPATPAGAVALVNAEMLVAVVLVSHLCSAPRIAVAAGPMASNMRLGTPCHADPHSMMVRLAGAQMARYYGVPGVLSGPNSDALCQDPQNGWESMFTTVTLLDSGCNILVNSGEFASASTVSYEQLVLDNEIFGICLKFLEGLEVSEDTLALDMIERLGPGGSCLAEKHTYTHYRSDYWRPGVTIRDTFVAWTDKGSMDVVAVAAEKARTILSEHHPRSLAESTRSTLHRLLETYERQNAPSD